MTRKAMIPEIKARCFQVQMRKRIKRRRSPSKGDGEEVFWLAGPKSDTISEGFGSGISTRKGLMLLIFRQPFRHGIASYNQRLEKSNRWIFQLSLIHLITLFSM